MQRPYWLPLVLVLAVLATPRFAAAQEQEGQPQGEQACPAGQTCPMPRDHEAMKERHEAMMQQHQEDAARIQELQDRMHAATGDAKVQAMEALLDEMLAQNRAMHEMMMGMHHPMGMDGMKHEEKEAEHPDD
jgi:hypothetical protein